MQSYLHRNKIQNLYAICIQILYMHMECGFLVRMSGFLVRFSIGKLEI